MVVLLALIPLYILIPAFFPPDVRFVPEVALDRAWPLVPAWSIVYGALYVFLIMLPIFVVRDDALLKKTMNAYVFIWITAYVFFFFLYPTAAPRPIEVTGKGFGVWGLRALYGADPPYNCFPSLHVAHSFVSALACTRVHRRLGSLALSFAGLVALSTVFTKQHYVLDVVTGILLAFVAYALFLRRFPPTQASQLDREAAPSLALLVGGLVSFGLAAFWIAYKVMGETQLVFGS